MAQRGPTGDRPRVDPVLWRTARWLIALIVFIAALGILFPLAVEAMREFVRLS